MCLGEEGTEGPTAETSRPALRFLTADFLVEPGMGRVLTGCLPGYDTAALLLALGE